MIMQVGGIGSGSGSHGSTHRVTGCIHDHDIQKDEQGAMRASLGQTSSSDANAQEKAAGEVSLMDLLRRTALAGRRVWGRIWGTNSAGNGTAAYGTKEDGAAGNDIAAHSSHIAAASTGVHTPPGMLKNNPYFTTAGDPGLVKENFIKKIRIKFRETTRQLTKRFGGSFSGRSSLNSKQQRPKKDLRRQSSYRENGLEIDCILTDDSYLLDSYDRKGEYSRLTTEVKRNGKI